MSGIQLGTGVVITEVFTVNGVPTNGTTVAFEVTDPHGVSVTYTMGVAPEVTHPSVGTYVLTLPPPPLAGTYYYEAVSTGTVNATSTGSFTILSSSVDPDESLRPQVGPCQSWADSQDVAVFAGNPVDANDVPIDLIQYAYAASEILFALSGRLFSGLCEKTGVRPCATYDSCGTQILSRGHVINWGGDSWNGSPCGCQALSEVLLSGYPVWQIIEVKIDGVVVDPDTYGIRDRRWLVRKGDPVTGEFLRWPGCQALNLEDTEDGTWSASYRYGVEPPFAGKLAAAELGAQVYNGLTGGECALPEGTTRVIRQGIVIEKMAFSAWGLQDGIWRTGLPFVDAFLNGFASTGARRRPVIWAPTRRLRYARPALQ